MPKALADTKGKALKEATKAAAAKGITKPKHTPTDSSHEALAERSMELASTGGPFGAAALAQLTGGGLDANQRAVVESKHASKMAGATHHRMESTMSTEKQVSEAQAKKEAETKAKIAAKEAKLKEAAEKKAAAEKAKQEAAEAKAKAAAEKKEAAEKAAAERKTAAEAKAKERAEAAAKRAEERANRPARERTYTGSMTTLADRVAAGQYVKGKNGQLRSSDEVALALEIVPAKQVVPVVLNILGLTTNPYVHLNYGQQSMNLRNKLRGAIKAGTKIGEGDDAPVINLDRVKFFASAAVTAPAEAGPTA